jgi:hypothetical protein
MYFDLAAGNTGYFDRLPGWLRETAQWTYEKLDGIDLASDFPWEKQFSLGGLFFTHANPFGYGDWTYLNGESELNAAMAALRILGERIGVFGHTHRGKVMHYAGDDAPVRRELGALPALSCRIGPGDGAVADPGSVGQPRGSGHCSSILFIETDETGIRFDLQRLQYDVSAHIARIKASTLSQDTKTKLMSYFA